MSKGSCDNVYDEFTLYKKTEIIDGFETHTKETEKEFITLENGDIIKVADITYISPRTIIILMGEYRSQIKISHGDFKKIKRLLTNLGKL